MRRFFQRAYHFLERIKNESRNFPKNLKHFGFRTAKAIFIDGLFPPGKSEKYITEIEHFIDEAMEDLYEVIRSMIIGKMNLKNIQNQKKFQYGYVGGKEKKVCQNW